MNLAIRRVSCSPTPVIVSAIILGARTPPGRGLFLGYLGVSELRAPEPADLAHFFEPKRDDRRWRMMSVSKVHLSDGTKGPRRRTPWESLALACAAMLPIAAGALACLLLHGDAATSAVYLTVVWSGAMLCFLSGVRRDLSFRQEDNPQLSRLAMMILAVRARVRVRTFTLGRAFACAADARLNDDGQL